LNIELGTLNIELGTLNFMITPKIIIYYNWELLKEKANHKVQSSKFQVQSKKVPSSKFQVKS